MTKRTTLVWFRQDLRCADNPALLRAVELGLPVVSVYVLDDETPGRWRSGGASRWWLHHSLAELSKELQRLGARLILRRGSADVLLPELAREVRAEHVVWNRRYEPHARAEEQTLSVALRHIGIQSESFDSQLLFEPGSVTTKEGRPFRVFSPFWRACLAQTTEREPLAAPATLPTASGGGRREASSDALEDWALLPTAPDWAGGLRETWRPGERGARERLETFFSGAMQGYASLRDRPDRANTSRLSPHLHFGEISPQAVAIAALRSQRAASVRKARDESDEDARKFHAELGWREFSYHLIADFPALPEQPLRPEFASMPWLDDPQGLKAWQRGRTGYPIVDAGMRELWRTGWMHNRVRMVAASFLVKDLLIDWRRGAAWFWETLVDADLASNSASWQWVAGCGADAAPFFRVFNPILQGEKFDPEGAYVRRWVPELGALPKRYIHKPWEAPPLELNAAGVRLGDTYPERVIEHQVARKRALAAFSLVSKKRG